MQFSNSLKLCVTRRRNLSDPQRVLEEGRLRLTWPRSEGLLLGGCWGACECEGRTGRSVGGREYREGGKDVGERYLLGQVSERETERSEG